jgi:hypothetical protein
LRRSEPVYRIIVIVSRYAKYVPDGLGVTRRRNSRQVRTRDNHNPCRRQRQVLDAVLTDAADNAEQMDASPPS